MSNEHRFAIGAWVRDPVHDKLCGGIVRDNNGNVRVEPSAGEVVAMFDKPWPAYKIVFGECSNVIFADGAECYICKALSDDAHEDWCYMQPGSQMRETEHEPGFAPA